MPSGGSPRTCERERRAAGEDEPARRDTHTHTLMIHTHSVLLASSGRIGGEDERRGHALATLATTGREGARNSRCECVAACAPRREEGMGYIPRACRFLPFATHTCIRVVCTHVVGRMTDELCGAIVIYRHTDISHKDNSGKKRVVNKLRYNLLLVINFTFTLGVRIIN